MTNEQETIKEQVSLLRKYAYEFGLHNDLETHALMMSAQKAIFDIIDAKDKELAAEQKAFKVERASHIETLGKLHDAKQRAEAAEARIKASQEQEPVAVVDCNYHDRVKWMQKYEEFDHEKDHWSVGPDGTKLYLCPIVPPELAELQRNMSNAINAQNELHEQYYQLQRENVELRKQLEVREVTEEMVDAYLAANTEY